MLKNIYKRFFVLTISVLVAVITFVVIINSRLRSDIVKMRFEEKQKQDVLLNVAVDVVGRVMYAWEYDYTYWDDMIKFVSTRDPVWAKINIEDMLRVAQIDAAWVFSKHGKLVYSYNQAHNPEVSKLPFGEEEKKKIFDNNKLTKKEYPHFFYKSNVGYVEALIMPIQPSADNERKQMPFGYMMVARIWTKEFFKEFQRITFSEIKIISPEEIKQKQYEVIKSDATVFSKIGLKDLNGKTISFLFSSYNSKSLQELINSSGYNIPIIMISVVLIVGAIIIALFFWVIHPLKIVVKSLMQENESLLVPIKEKSTEFGLIADLIHQFFEQRTSLRNEINFRKEIERELREIKANLEIKVEERTTDLVQAKEKAEAANRLKSVFLTNLSHELRTPLFGVLGNADLLLEIENQKVKQHANLIYKSGQRLKETLNNLLDLAKIEAEKLELKLMEYNINDVVLSVTELFKAEAIKKGLTLKVVVPRDAVIAKIDLKVLEDTINNLVQNAIKFTFAGEILVTLGFTDKDFILTVKDTGIGIPKENLEMIFDQFRQASEGIGRSYEGSGLGLALTKKYVQLLGGAIMVSSEVGGGSEFMVSIPHTKIVSNQTQRQAKPSEKNKSKNNLSEKNLPVLLVEDDLITQEVIRLFLTDSFEVDLAINAEEALNKIRDNEYHAVLMDINLGRGLNGIHVTKEIRRLPGVKSKLPIVAQTAFAMKSDREEFINAGCDYYLAKPFSKEELKGVLSQINVSREM